MSRAWAVALVALAVVAYLPALEAGFVWDDDDNVTGNAAVASPGGLLTIWTEPADVPPWYPLAHSALWLEYRLWGLEPAGYHAVNVFLHALNALLVWTLLRRLDVPGAWLGAALFAVHPVQVESVAWITEQKNVLATTLALGAALCWLRFRPALARQGPGRNGGTDDRVVWRAWGAAAALFVLALLTKTVTATLPVVLLLVTWWKLGRVGRRDVLATVPLFVAALVLGGFTAWLEQHAVGARGPEWERSLLERSTIAGRALWFYAAKLVWPWPVTYVYPRFRMQPIPPWGWVAPLAALALPLLLWRLRRGIGRGPLTAVACGGVIVAPALGFFDVYYMRYTFVADRWVYQACVPFLALLAAVAVGAADRVAAAPALRRGAAALLLGTLAAATWSHATAFRDEETLWRDTLAKNPAAIVAHNNLGNILLARGATAEATRHFQQAIAIDDTWPETHNNLGTARFRAGDPGAAAREHERAIELQPGFADAHNNLGVALAALGRMDEALAHLRRAVELQPGMANARFNLGIALQYRHADAAALEHLAEAARLTPDDAPTRAHLALALARADRHAEAAAQYRAALERQPDDARTRARLAWLLATCADPAVRDGIAAVELAEPLVREAPDAVPHLETLAAALAESGRFGDAVQIAERALSLAPGAESGPVSQRQRQRITAQLDGYRRGRPTRTPADCPRCWQ